MIAEGTRLKERYRLERLLGRGGMASVWRACDETLDRPVAIKLLSDTIADDPEFLARFRREARVAAGLSHPNLVGVYDYAEAGERPYLVMEYVPGETVAELMARGAELDCGRLARELLGALAHVHSAGILHRDIKPQNVVIGPDGRAKLIDFGIALPKDATALTQTGHLLGTARFLAPELTSGESATERSDLYSCGVLLGDCIGDRPGGGPGALAAALASPDPRDRPATAREAIARLDRTSSLTDEPTQRIHRAQPAAFPQRTTEEVPMGATEEVPKGATARRPSRPRAAHRMSLAAGAALLVLGVALIGGLVALIGGPEERPSSGDRAPDRAQAAGKTSPAESGEPKSLPAVAQPTGSDPGQGSALNEQGFALIQEGRYEEAVPVLEDAVEAFPPGTEDLNYAYALFNLGNALRLSGRPEEAVPILEQRLQIPNQTGTVRRELAAAQREAAD